MAEGNRLPQKEEDRARGEHETALRSLAPASRLSRSQSGPPSTRAESKGRATPAETAGYFFGGCAWTVKTTSPEPVLPAASRTRNTTTYVPGFSASVLNLNVSVLLSNRPSVGKTFTHFLPLSENDAAVSRTSSDEPVASRTAAPSSMPTTLTCTPGGVWLTTNGSLTREPVSTSPGALSRRSLATTFSRYTPDGVVVVSHSYSVFSRSSSRSTQF